MTYMVLYHLNVGFSILDEDSKLVLNSEIIPRDEEAQKGVHLARRMAVTAAQ